MSHALFECSVLNTAFAKIDCHEQHCPFEPCIHHNRHVLVECTHLQKVWELLNQSVFPFHHEKHDIQTV